MNNRQFERSFLEDFYVKQVKDKYKLQLNIKFEQLKLHHDKIVKLMNNLGWFPSKITFLNKQSEIKTNNKIDLNFIEGNAIFNSPCQVYFEAKFKLELSQEELPNKIYHISPTIYRNKILKQGLVSKNKIKLNNHLERIYFLLDKKYIRIN